MMDLMAMERTHLHKLRIERRRCCVKRAASRQWSGFRIARHSTATRKIGVWSITALLKRSLSDSAIWNESRIAEVEAYAAIFTPPQARGHYRISAFEY